jgi:hypothetical protein
VPNSADVRIDLPDRSYTFNITDGREIRVNFEPYSP